MADKTAIEWTDATWNPITGCSVASPGCTNCYAMELAGTRLKGHASRIGLTREVNGNHVWTGETRFNEQWLDQPLRWSKPRMIFVCAHGDPFHESVPDEWIDAVFVRMALAPWHIFQVLTKRSARMREYMASALGRIADAVIALRREQGDRSPLVPLPHITPGSAWWPLPNVWLGVSVEDQARADERIPDLLATPAAVRWLSCEPLLGPVDLRMVHYDGMTNIDALTGDHGVTLPLRGRGPGLDWIVAGGESGSKARPMHPDWARSLRDQCAAAGVPFLFKQWGEYALGGLYPSGTPGKFAMMSFHHDSYNRTAFLDHYPRQFTAFGSTIMERVGKKSAGRLLDGREWSEFPA